MNYKQTIDFLFSQLPMFHRIGAAAYKANFDNITSIADLIGNPQNDFKSVHIAGTNGKGSVSNMLASVFAEAGYKTGLYTSPHLKDFRERIRINGKMVEEEFVIQFVDEYKKIFDDIKPSFFEWSTALAFEYFASEKVDVAIIETGLGGRLDSTNIITPELSVITNISYDHMNLLGDTLEKIAYEKAGIIKPNVPVVIGERQRECELVFIKKAAKEKSNLIFASNHFTATQESTNETHQTLLIKKNGENYFAGMQVSLKGIYQEKNICTVIQSYEILKRKFPDLNDTALLQGVEHVQSNTGLRGRWDVLNENPLTIADIGHNQAGISMVVNQLKAIMSDRNNVKLHIVFGMVSDKDPNKILSLLPSDATYYFTQPDLPRAMDVNELVKFAEPYNLSGKIFNSVSEALHAARAAAKERDVIFIGGSTFVVAEAI